MKPSGKTTVGATVLAGAVNTIAVFAENKLGAGLTPEVAAAQGVVFIAVFGAYLPRRLRG
jgi:hypothetical protein